MILSLVVVAAVTIRYGVVTPYGRAFVERVLGGLKVGPYGRVRVEGIEGDVWSDFTVRRLTISDVHGAWLDARQLHVRWDWLPMLSRRLTLDEIDARLITVIRQPATEAAGPPGGHSPVSLHVGKLAAQLEMLPAFSSRYGLYDLAGSLDIRRERRHGRQAQRRQPHPCWRSADADFDLGRDKTIRLALRAQEAGGGAMAGALGLAADQLFNVIANASGTVSQGRFHVESLSGPLVPIAGDGAWTPSGGQANGRIVLAASKYLTWFQHWFGPDLRFQIAGSRAADGLQNLALNLASENIDVGARGEADLGRRTFGPKGLPGVDPGAPGSALSRLPADGRGPPERLADRQPGSLDAGRSARGGRTDGVRLPAGAGQRSGEVRVGRGSARDWRDHRRDWRRRPRRDRRAARRAAARHEPAGLAAGRRVLIKQLTILGPGLKVDGQGDPGLLGGLSFHGQATFSNFAVAQPGARGLMTTSWSANQERAQSVAVRLRRPGEGLRQRHERTRPSARPAPTLKGQGRSAPRASRSPRRT